MSQPMRSVQYRIYLHNIWMYMKTYENDIKVKRTISQKHGHKIQNIYLCTYKHRHICEIYKNM